MSLSLRRRFLCYDSPVSSPTTEAPSIQIGGQVQQWPDGRHMCVIMVGNGMTSFQFALPPAAAEQAADTLPEMFKQLAEQARQADSGLTLPPVQPKGLIKP